MTQRFVGYCCSLCGAEYGPEDVTYTCPNDGGNLDVVLDYKDLASQPSRDLIKTGDASLWRYLALLPVHEPGGWGTPFRAAGWTPVFEAKRLAQKIGLANLWVKDESRNPTASFKDRASAVVVARAREIGAEVVVTASTGNAGAALAGMAAAIGHKAVIFAPKTAPPAKIAQLLVFGAEVILVDSNYDSAFDLSIEAANEFGWYCRNTGYNPFTAEGKKTAAFEMWELILQGVLAHSVAKPLCVFVSVGDGNIISGIHKGFRDLVACGHLETTPRIFGIQSTGSAAVANAYFANTEAITPVSANTLADSISVDLPRDGVRAVRAARQTGGVYLTVEDREILESIAELGQMGVFAEPAGSTAYAGLVKSLREGIIQPDDPVLVVNTGSGLKDVRAAMQSVQDAPIIEPTLAAVKKILHL